MAPTGKARPINLNRKRKKMTKMKDYLPFTITHRYSLFYRVATRSIKTENREFLVDGPGEAVYLCASVYVLRYSDG